jgi:tRNA-Thr(GGU) m(6)t(6)A37 methyltransferase TsaA
MSMDIKYTPIGIIHSPFKAPKGVPVQAAVARDVNGTIEVFPEYRKGLKDLEGFSHIILLCHFHLTGEPDMMVKPFLDENKHGVFATRAPRRPNSIGLSVVKVLKVEGNIIHVAGLDIVEGTPLLDIKPYIPQFDNRENARIGWLEANIDKLHDNQR